jgi:hypothetical protein
MDVFDRTILVVFAVQILFGWSQYRKIPTAINVVSTFVFLINLVSMLLSPSNLLSKIVLGSFFSVIISNSPYLSQKLDRNQVNFQKPLLYVITVILFLTTILFFDLPLYFNIPIIALSLLVFAYFTLRNFPQNFLNLPDKS